MHYLLNALPGAIIPECGGNLRIEPVDWSEIPKSVESAVGHVDTAAIISAALGWTVPPNRVSIPKLADGDIHYLALYQGPRLPEGATTLPEGATLKPFRLVFKGAEKCD